MTAEKLAKEIRKFCEKNADEKTVKKYARYFVEGYDAYGINPKLIESQRARWLEKYRNDVGFDGFLKLGDLIVREGKYEEVFFAIWIASQFSGEFTPKTLERFGKWIENGVKNRARSDVLSGKLLSVFLVKNIVPLDKFSDWQKSGNRWKRRAIPVTMIEYLRTEPAIKALLDFIDPLMMDEEKVVRQGLGWFLREAWKKYPAPVEKFLLRWKDKCGRLIIQYATEKMRPQDKEKFRRNKD